MSRLVNKKLIDCDYEPKGQEFSCTILEDLPPILNNVTITEINTIDHILDRPNLKELQTKDAYCRHIKQSLHIPSVRNIFKLDNSTLYRHRMAIKDFEALIVPRSLIPTIPINSHHLQGYAGKIKSYIHIKREFFSKDMHKDIDKFIQNCNICKQHNFQKQYYSYIHTTPGRRPFDFIACDLVGPCTHLA